MTCGHSEEHWRGQGASLGQLLSRGQSEAHLREACGNVYVYMMLEAVMPM